MTTPAYYIAPAQDNDPELAGKENTFATVAEALTAAIEMDRTCPLDGDEWVVFEYGSHERARTESWS